MLTLPVVSSAAVGYVGLYTTPPQEEIVMSTTAAVLLTAEEYAELPDDGRPTELVRGVVVSMNMPTPRHVEICLQTGYLLKQYLETHPVGRAVSNDAGVVTERGPDTVRGADIAFFSYAKTPRGSLPRGYLSVAPELVFEVRSTGDRWRKINEKVYEYLNAGVTLVCVLDQQTETAHVFHADQAPREVKRDEELTLPEVFADFRILVRRFFE
jgi:Uma2 family endonuclease